MIDVKKREIVLGIETAVNGGSLSILENDVELDFRLGQTAFSRAEDTLQQIEFLFQSNGINKETLKLISVSVGAGSLTGLKTGLSTALGLSKSLGCPLIKTPVLQALLIKADKNALGSVITAVPNGKKFISWQVFNSAPIFSEQPVTPQISVVESFIERVINGDFSQAIFHEAVYKLFTQYTIDIDKQIKCVNVGSNLALLLAQYAVNRAKCV